MEYVDKDRSEEIVDSQPNDRMADVTITPMNPSIISDRKTSNHLLRPQSAYTRRTNTRCGHGSDYRWTLVKMKMYEDDHRRSEGGYV